jgi:hypothetical protein
LGFHEVSESTCSRVGFIILHIVDKPEEFFKLKMELTEIGGIEVQEMNFSI